MHLNTRSSRAHLDYHQDDEERVKFYTEFDLPSGPMGNRTEPHALLGHLDTEEEKLGVMLGVWKPLAPSEATSFLSFNSNHKDTFRYVIILLLSWTPAHLSPRTRFSTISTST